MRRILFVDDDPKVLEALKGVLAPQAEAWEMSFVQGGRGALAMLEATPLDVIVTSPEVSGSQGAGLLGEVRERYPGLVRIVFSEQKQASLYEVSLAHQFLPKPFEPAALRVAVERACGLKDFLDDEVIQRTVGSVKDLPSIPRVYQELSQALSHPDASLDVVGRIVEKDLSISAKLLKLVNSSFFGTISEIATVRTAVSYLGLKVIKNLVLSTEVFQVFQGSQKIEGFSQEDLQTHAQLTAKIAGRLPLAKHLADTAMVAALLHDVGKLVLAWKMPGRFERLLKVSREENRPLNEVEQEMCGTTHAEIGAYLLGMWGLPNGVTEAVAHHHAPGRVPHLAFDAISAVYVASWLANDCAAAGSGEATAVEAPLDMAYLEEMGVADQVPAWRKIAEREFSATTLAGSGSRR